MKEILAAITNTGKLPELPFVVSVEEKSIIKLAVAAVITATIIILIANLVKRN